MYFLTVGPTQKKEKKGNVNNVALGNIAAILFDNIKMKTYQLVLSLIEKYKNNINKIVVLFSLVVYPTGSIHIEPL